MISEWVSQYGGDLVRYALYAVLGFIGIALKTVITDWFKDKTKRAIAKTCVLAVEQMYKDLHGEEKLNKCLSLMEDMLAEKGIELSVDTMRMYIEEQVAKLNVVVNEVE